jgi:N-acetylneuraminic acid mutarotase
VSTVDDQHFDHPGVVITASTGDQGFPGGYPAASKFVTAVGGTSLVRDAASPRGWSESAWRLAGSDCSPFEPAPSFQSQALTDCTMRATADVSAVADPETGVAVYDDGWQVFGGTSVSSPIVAATYALAGAPLTGSRPNALPYQHTDALNDVTTGKNGNCGFKFCLSQPGWDGPTGLGTPIGVGAFSPGPHGELVGTVTDSAHAPVPGATVAAGAQQVTSGPHGEFALTLPPGHYDLTADKFGYAQNGRPADLADGQTVTADITLTARPRAAVSGTVADASGHGWPMYASVQVRGEPSTRVFTDPATGAYHLSLPTNTDYDLDVDPVYPGYEQVTRPVSVGADAVAADVAEPVTFESCDALGYQYTTTPVSTQPFDATTTPKGWSLVDSLDRGLLWRFDDPGQRGNLTGGSGNFAMLDSWFANPAFFQDTSLVSPAWDLSGMTHPAVSFHNDYFGTFNSRATVELTTDGGQTWTRLWIHQQDSVRGPDLETIDLSQWAGQPAVQVRFRYQGTATFWWEVDDVTLGERACSPKPGGLVVGTVTDKNTGSGLTGASVASGDSNVATTVGTPDDPALPEGRYAFFAEPGSYPLTATQPGGYQPVARTVGVADDAVVPADFPLPAGRVEVGPSTVGASVTLGDARTATLTVRNTGSAPATVSLNDVPGGVAAMSAQAGPATQHLAGTFRPGSAGATADVQSAGITSQAAPWQTAADFPIPVTDTSLASDHGAVYAAGGASSNFVPLSRAYRYDPDAAAWTRLADMRVGRDFPASAFLDGKLYVAGGWDDSPAQVTGTMEVYDPATNTWSDGPAMPTAVAGAGAAILDNRMYVVGGCTTSTVCNSTTVQVYDPAANRWEPAAEYPRQVSFQGCGAIGAKVYCAGGVSDDTGASRDGWAYDPVSDHWTQIAGLPLGSQWGASSAAADGRLLLVGGVFANAVLTNEGWAYDPATNTWASLPNANTVDYRSAGACGFYRVGGTGVQPALPNAELLPGYGDCSSAGGVSWLSVTPAGPSTLAPGASLTVTVRLDSSADGVDQPGDYLAGLALSEDTPYPFAAVPVTMTVSPPKSWGKLAGTVTGKACDGSTALLGAATVSVTGKQQSFTLKTDTAGRYQLWLDARNSPLSLVVGKNGWTPAGTSGVKLAKGKTTTADFALVPSPTC